MKQQADINIKFCFPEMVPTDPYSFVTVLASLVSKLPRVGYAGYHRKKDLMDDLEGRFEYLDVRSYIPPGNAKKTLIEKHILQVLKKCIKRLPPQQDVPRVFVFPSLGPFDDIDELIGRVSGFTPHKDVIHLFLDPHEFSLQSLERAVAHEYNHAVFFQYRPLLHPFHPSTKARIFDMLLWEGLAQNFEVEVTGLDPAPYAIALSEKESRDVFRSLTSRTLNSHSMRVYEEIFFGGGEYKMWSGYAIAYHLVRVFREKNPDVPWEELLLMDAEDVLK